jgi:hypothetical protein
MPVRKRLAEKREALGSFVGLRVWRTLVVCTLRWATLEEFDDLLRNLRQM